MIRAFSLICALLATFGVACSTTTAGRRAAAPDHRLLTPLPIGPVSVRYSDGLAVDRRQRAQENSVAPRLESNIRHLLEATGLSPGDNRLEVELTEFRLPASGTRWMTGQLKGNDYLDSSVTVRGVEGSPIVIGDVRAQLGAMDRSIGENFSADFALKNLLDNLGWRIVFELTPPGRDDAILKLGKEMGIVPAIQELGWRGGLTYGEAVKYASTDSFRGDAKLVACVSSLAKPGWLPAFLWDFPLFGLHGACAKTAEEHRWRGKTLIAPAVDDQP